MELKPTADQAKALEALAPAFSCEATGVRAVLMGFAGTGKTWTLGLLAKLAEEIPLANGEKHDYDEEEGGWQPKWDELPRVVFCAPTHKAATQIKKSLRANGCDLDVVTIHAALALRPRRREDKEYYEPDRKATALVGPDTRLIVIDECSMISKLLVGYLKEAIKACPDVNIVAVGDPAQLPPVGDPSFSPLFKMPLQLMLTEVVRYGGCILDIATETRNMKLGRPPFIAQADEFSKIATYRYQAEWKQAAVRECFRAWESGDYDAARVLSYTNHAANEINQAVHEMIYGEGADEFFVGQPIVSYDAIKRDGEIVCSGSTEMRIVELKSFTDKFLGDDIPVLVDAVLGEGAHASGAQVNGFRCWRIAAQVFGAEELITFYVVAREDAAAWGRGLSALSKEAKRMRDKDLPKAKTGEDEERIRKEIARLWEAFWGRKDSVGEVRYIWAMTVHKSQGSTFQKVFVHHNIDWVGKKGGEAGRWHQNKLAYVAITRAAKEVHAVADFENKRIQLWREENELKKKLKGAAK